MRTLAVALILLFSVSASAGQADDHSRDILWQTRAPSFIAHLATASGLGPGRRAIAWWGSEPCIIMTPEPPPETAPEIVIRRWLADLNHERRHCREKQNFHRGN